MKGNFTSSYNITYENKDKQKILHRFPYICISYSNEELREYFEILRDDIMEKLELISKTDLMFCNIYLYIFYEESDNSEVILEHNIKLKAVNIFSKTETYNELKRYYIGRLTDGNIEPKKNSFQLK